MALVIPTIGRVVHYHCGEFPDGTDGRLRPRAAIVTDVAPDGTCSLQVLGFPYGNGFNIPDVPPHPGDGAWHPCTWSWPAITSNVIAALGVK